MSGATYNIGIQTNLPQGRVANNYVIQDTISYLRGAHTFRGGFDLLKQRSRQFAPINERGSLIYNAGGNFTGWLTSLTTSGVRRLGQPRFRQPVLLPGVVPAVLLLPGSLARKRGAHAHPGVRYENFGNPVNSVVTAAFTGLFNVDPVTLQGPYTQPSEAATDNNNFAPTIGVAFSPSFKSGLLGMPSSATGGA